MRSNKLVFSTVVVSVISILFSGCIFSCEKQKKRNNDWLSEEFVPIFEDVNKQLCDTFSYESVLYSSGNLKEFSLTFLGDGSEFIEYSIEFCNLFSAAMADDKYSTYRLSGEYILRVKNSDIFLNCWYTKSSSSLTASTNVPNNCTIFETLKGIRKLTVVTKKFTEEEKEYAKSFQDKCSFELVFSDKIPW